MPHKRNDNFFERRAYIESLNLKKEDYNTELMTNISLMFHCSVGTINKDILYFIKTRNGVKVGKQIYYTAPKNLEKLAEYKRNKMSRDPVFKFKCYTRSLIYNSFRRGINKTFIKSKKTEELLGCTMNEFIEYIQNKLKEGMTLENYGKWHIDHKYPLSKAKSISEINLLNHFSNLQPLWAKENITKSNNI